MSGNPTVLFVGPDQVEVRSLERPSPGAGEVLVQTRCTLISPGTELTLLGGMGRGRTWSALTKYPRQSGYSNVGVVRQVGPGVDEHWLGRRVHNHGPHAAWALAPAAKLVEVPASVPDELATFATLAKVALNGLRRGNLAWGEAVVLCGLGIVGQLTARAALLAGAGPLFVIEPSEARLALLPPGPFESLPAESAKAWPELIRTFHRGRLADVAFELSGQAEALPNLPDCVREMGRLVIVSSPRGACLFDFHDLCNRRSLAILGAHSSAHPVVEDPGMPWSSARHAELFLDWIANDRTNLAGLITHRFPAERAADAYAVFREAGTHALGVVLEWPS